MQAAREAARRTQCLDNIKNMALGCTTYESAKQKMPYGRKFDYLGHVHVDAGHSALYRAAGRSTSCTGRLPDEKPLPIAARRLPNGPIGPIGDDARLRQARHSQIPVYYCPSDNHAHRQRNEHAAVRLVARQLSRLRRRRRHVRHPRRRPRRPGACQRVARRLRRQAAARIALDRWSSRNRLQEITDGTSNTILISEGVAPTVPHWGGPIGGIIYGNMGGSLFSAAYTPNTGEFDKPIGPCPLNDQRTPSTSAPCQLLGGHPGPANPGGAGAHVAARSKHPGGVNAAMVDGSVRFVNDSIDTLTWRWMGTSDRDDLSRTVACMAWTSQIDVRRIGTG